MNNLAIATVLCIIAVCSFSGVEGNLMCYNCTYTKVLGFEVGEMGCKSPFVAAGISEVSCDGSCVKRELKGDIPTTMRTCHTLLEGDCVDLNNFEISAGNTISQDCCTTSLCNGAGALAFSLFVVVTALCGALAVNH